ncbi:MAG: putative nucleotidyltransferase substrate binding domain-containing protein [Acidobacteriota bacterium]
MQTAAIRYRVADFLKQYPPFQSMEEPDLLELVEHGRVKFHQGDEFLCWQNTAYSPYLFVIQQGAVSLWEEAEGKETLRDIRGPGDIIGAERFMGSTAYAYSARSNGEVMVYALPAADFEPLLRKYPQANRYINANAAAGSIYQDERRGVHEMFVAELVPEPEPFTCRPECTVTEAARIMRTVHTDALAVMDGYTLLGLVTASDILGWIADGGSVTKAVRDIMGAPPPPVAPQTLVSDCVLAMSPSTGNVVALTGAGTYQSGLMRLVTAADLQPAFGDSPLALMQEISLASNIESLRLLHLRARAFLLAQLTEPSAVDWLAAFSDRINVSVVKRLLELAGYTSERRTWCFWGAAGRRELLCAVEPEIALLAPEDSDLNAGQAALQRLRADLSDCGYIPYTAPDFGAGFLCATELTWRGRFKQWVSDPIQSQIYRARPLFDMRFILGSADVFQRLVSDTNEIIGGSPEFQKLLANDCLSALPPLTFFQDAVVDEDGGRTEVFAVESHALEPMVEVGRVFGVVHQMVLGSSTLNRLEQARSKMPADDAVFRKAAETLRLVLYLQARSGLRLKNSGAEILPSQLSQLDRQVLKGGFRAIHNLLDFTVNRIWAEAL